MRLVIEIPDDFKAEYASTRFHECLLKVSADLDYINTISDYNACGDYERTFITMLRDMFNEFSYDIDTILKDNDFDSVYRLGYSSALYNFYVELIKSLSSVSDANFKYKEIVDTIYNYMLDKARR